MIRSHTPWIVLFLSAMVLPATHINADDVQSSFVPSGAMKRLGGYRPLRSEMDRKADIVDVTPDGLESPKFGYMEIGDSRWAFILDEPEGKPARLYIDCNGDRDLTNDPETTWEPQKQGELTMYNGHGQVDLGEGRLGTLGIYRFDPSEERRAQLKNTLLFYTDYGFEYEFELDGKEFSSFVGGDLSEDTSLRVDRDGNGKVSGRFEQVTMGEPFNFTGTTHLFRIADGKLTLQTSADAVPQLPLPPDLQIGKPALPFTATSLDGTDVDFPKQYAGKIVMLDFWATWCGPCIGEIPHMKKAYADWHDQGFEILGISFDREGMADKVGEFLKDNDLPWRQIYEGKSWETTLGLMYDVSGIPFVLLVDGDTGTILATARELRGEGLSDYVGDKLKQKKHAGK